jgi:hypothetical protein
MGWRGWITFGEEVPGMVFVCGGGRFCSEEGGMLFWFVPDWRKGRKRIIDKGREQNSFVC